MKLPKRNQMNNKSKLIINFDYKYKQLNDGMKPNGFWYSCYDSWFNWTHTQGMFIGKYIHKINIKNNAMTNIDNKNKNKLLVIKSIEDFDKFNKKYGYIPNRYKKIMNKFLKKEKEGKLSNWEIESGGLHYYLIRWDKVINDYGGIEICPWLKKRMYYFWYSSFDVASGCIWNTKAILKDTKLIYKMKKGKYKG